ncbi:MAG TPA: OmpH family outer membrane protein [Flavobacterium sp.]|jgi:outer membrane protein
MKTFPYLSIAAILISCIALYFSQKNGNELVYVDVNKLIEGYSRTKVEKALFEKKALTIKAKVDTLIGDWQNELKIYERERSSLSTKELQLKQELLSSKQSQINAFQENYQKQIQEEETKMTRTIVNDINDYIKEYGEKNGHTIIFGAGGTGNIMYADDASDLTDDVLKQINAAYDKK